MLGSCGEPLARVYDLAMLDLDGVVYVGDHAVGGAPEAIDAARALGMAVAFVTNNAARPPAAVAEHLSALGVPARADDVVTSAQAGARVVRERHGAGTMVFLCGGPGVEEALLAEQLVPTADPAAAEVVVTGYGPDLPWRRILEASILVRDGRPWVATNADLTIPTSNGVGLGHGAVVKMIEEFSGRRAIVAGKPQRPLLDETVRRMAARRPLMVGDRLDTDIEGAQVAGVDSLLVLTGVSGLDDLAAAAAPLRPTYVAADLGGLLVAHEAPTRVASGAWHLNGWSGEVVAGELVVHGDGAPEDWWRVVACAAWRHLDDTGRPVALGRVRGSVPWCA
ncbi:haloacid dehalogenase [Nocardioides phosphati]|uniref:Haloacid dehalogenase n=1 Tax=Nocardioides phosphati TaxID=1867775 RepID=A0ABQ2NDT4_9ACTN|nr:HAD-IIA family hydrolase [Nocardioides phosphati]GGO92106.1 haloacid dehalogenase [Nocardioides phosphati]